ncbi:Diaminopimelate decarboxylase [bioreactor metagenome]|uniref:Diaminopimelate decarboxylase n=1 Tax=bioreactor metagenome TaxID=1076179 RepID=A0A645FFX8_9ZZZZ
MMTFLAQMKQQHGYEAQQLDLGGGFGVRYTDEDPVLDVQATIGELAGVIHALAAELGITMPAIRMEPGRSIVADAGMTLYTAGSVKRITGYKNYVSIDGGMTDNPRFALYGSRYTLYNAGKMNDPQGLMADVVGRCCESGDIIQKKVPLPATVRGDTIAVLTTGAYNYSMASNYNRIGRPPVVLLSQGSSKVAVKRESLDDLIANDI